MRQKKIGRKKNWRHASKSLYTTAVFVCIHPSSFNARCYYLSTCTTCPHSPISAVFWNNFSFRHLWQRDYQYNIWSTDLNCSYILGEYFQMESVTKATVETLKILWENSSPFQLVTVVVILLIAMRFKSTRRFLVEMVEKSTGFQVPSATFEEKAAEKTRRIIKEAKKQNDTITRWTRPQSLCGNGPVNTIITIILITPCH